MSESIHISVETKYIGQQERASNDLVHVFSYTVNITNLSDRAMTLRSRYWLITNGDGEKVEVSGEGVVGEQPTIAPQQSFQYTSASLLKTQVGSMQGYYDFEQADMSTYRAHIPVFRLAVPNALH
ncbi:Co2+/Mg2+ efflux protein ApaG [Glaciecola siphonariae]|uniref:Co2+/Mg2+ efflux protein ApaG n=1 Tax=Glaciecola siphonariae TaxID=521012 RepID=A0ABV9LZ81_9ALTE